MRTLQDNPTAMSAFLGKADKVLRYVPTPDGKLHAFLTDRNWEEQRNTQPMPVHRVVPDANGKPSLEVTGTVPQNGDTMQNILSHEQGVYKDYWDATTKWATAQKDIAGKPEGEPKNYQEALAQASAATNPAEKARLTALGNDLYQRSLRERTAGRTTVTAGYTPPPAGTEAAGAVQKATRSGAPVIGTQWGGGDPNSSFERTARGLIDGSMLITDLSPRAAKGQPGRPDYFSRASQIAEDSGQDFSPQQVEREARYYKDNKVTAAFNAMDRLVGPMSNPDPHNPPLLDQLEREARRAGVWDTNAPFSSVIQNVRQKWGEGEANALQTDLEDLRTNLATIMGTPGLTGGLTDKKLEQWSGAFGQNMTMDSLRAMSREIRTAVGSERASAFRTNRYLRHDYGPRAPVAGGTQPPPGGGPPPPQPPTFTPDATQPANRPPNVPPGYVHGTDASGRGGWFKP